MARARKIGNRDLAGLNLYLNRVKGHTYYRWRDPRDGRYYSLGKNRKQAITDAKAINAVIYNAVHRTLLERIQQGGKTFGQWLDRYWELFQERTSSKNTLKTRKSQIKAWRVLADKPLKAVSVGDIANLINQYRDAGKHRAAQALRSAAIDIFKDAIAEGWCDDNPATKTRSPKVEVKRDRLTLDQFMTILNQAKKDRVPWVANSMLLALATGQRVEDISKLRFSDVSDGWLFITQSKTGMKQKISLELRLESINLSVGEVISRCRDNVVSRYIIHHTRKKAYSKPGEMVHKQTLSRRFTGTRSKALPDDTWEKAPATFHEIRSLAAREWTKQEGKDFAQALLGHKDERMTAVYRDTRGAEWVEVKR